MSKISIRFFDDREVRAIWDDDNATWWFSVVDIVAVLNEQDDFTKAGNYWRWLKRKLRKEKAQFVSGTHRLKLTAADGKKYLTDVLDSDGIIALAKHFPNTRATRFLDWFLYSENSLDGQSRKKAYTLFESGIIDSIEVGTAKGLQQFHAYLFGGLYPFAGQVRQKNISKGGFQFATSHFLGPTLKQIDHMPEDTFDDIVAKYVEMNVAHPFMEGNGRATRIWLDLILKKRLERCVDWSRTGKKAYMGAMMESPVNATALKKLMQSALTDQIHSREMFMNGIDHSYYYEEE